MVNKGQNERKCRSMVLMRHSFWTMKKPMMKHKLLRFPRVDCQTMSPCHFRQDFAFYQDEGWNSCLDLALVWFLSKDFSPFWRVSWRHELVLKAWPRLLSINKKCNWVELFAANSRWGVNDLWGLRHLGGLLTFINKCLLVNNLHVSVFYLHFLGNDSLNDKL